VLAFVQFAERKGRDLPGSVRKVGFTIYRRVSDARLFDLPAT
jgi:hypothetical protein